MSKSRKLKIGHKVKIGIANTGKKRSDEWKKDKSAKMKAKWTNPKYRKMIMESRKGKMKPWNKGKTGVQKGWSAGKKFPYKARPTRKGKFAGENHWNWKGGVTSKNKLERSRFGQMIQKQVFERDDYTCQMCEQRGGKLQVDHIQSWKDYVELRFSIDNCRTLCQGCHYKITFG